MQDLRYGFRMLRRTPGFTANGELAMSVMARVKPGVPLDQARAELRRRASLNWAGPNYFDTLGIPRIAGRDFTFEDEGRPRVAIVSAAMARYYYGNRSAIGQIITFDGQPRPYEIVGVVGDATYLNLHEPIPRMV